MKINTILILLALFASAVVPGWAQQEPMFTQYQFNGMLINPAYIGTHIDLTANIVHRSQWVGLKGAPHTTSATLNGMLKDGVNAIGGGVFNDYFGVTNTTHITGFYAYHLAIGEKIKLSMGLRGGFSVTATKIDKLQAWDEGDPVYNMGRRTLFSPDIGAGLYLYHANFFAGISMPTLLSFDPNEALSIKSALIPNRRRHYMLSGGYLFRVSEKVMLRPVVLLKYVWTAPLQADFNFSVGFLNRYWVGASYRTGEAISGLIDIQAAPILRIGYSFDWSLNKLSNFTAGSHEILFGILFSEKADRFKNPRFF